MIRHASILTATLAVMSSLSAQEPAPPPVVGTWDLTLTAPDGRALPSWLEVHVSGRGVLVGRFVGVVGSVRPISRLTYANDTLRFAIPPQWETGSADVQFAGVVTGDALAGTITDPGGNPYPFTAVRAPALRRTTSTWAAPLPLFNGKDLTGWHTVGGTNQWSAVNGVLTNAKGGANLVTDAVFTDFKLHVEVRYPPRGNSGVYLRGRHEVQVVTPAQIHAAIAPRRIPHLDVQLEIGVDRVRHQIRATLGVREHPVHGAPLIRPADGVPAGQILTVEQRERGGPCRGGASQRGRPHGGEGIRVPARIGDRPGKSVARDDAGELHIGASRFPLRRNRKAQRVVCVCEPGNRTHAPHDTHE